MQIIKNDLFDYPKRYIYQIKDGFKFSLDSILLAEYIDNSKNAKILDMCTGNAPIPLIISSKTNNEIVGFEIQKDIAKLATLSVEINNLSKQVTIINDDINNINKYYKAESFDIISCNPPYFKDSNKNNASKNDYLKIARHEITININDIFKLAFKFLKNNGILYMVHRPNRLDDIIYYARINKVPVKEMQLITTKKGKKPSIVLLKCVKNGKSNIKVQPIISIEGIKTYQNIFDN